ncbi:MAG: DUF2959 domain-containing protein [Pseudomonadales bacterium]|nr:DUF2959 domain-containing protein [Pseudomonadales bacterium]
MRLRLLILLALTTLLSSCDTVYLDAMERVGIPKREILIDRIEDAQEAQEDGQEQFKTALEQFRSVVNFDGGNLEKVYNELNDEYEDSVAAAEEIRERIEAVESVANALFSEWEDELALYSNPKLKRDVEKQLQETRRKYSRLLSAMKRAESSINPVLASLQDNVLYLKHSLNARAIASLKGELQNVDKDVSTLIANMQKAIDESNAFINDLKSGQ